MNLFDSSVFTVGHSSLTYEAFLNLIRKVGINAIADVRSSPFSKHLPHFNKDVLRRELKVDGISYTYLGDELGGRPKSKQFFCDGIADYEKMAKLPSFKSGLSRIIHGAERYRIAIMCSEHNPLDCHRCLLVGRALKEMRISVMHILANGRLRSQIEIETELLKMSGTDERQRDFFNQPSDHLNSAYRQRSLKVAFAEENSRSIKIIEGLN